MNETLLTQDGQFSTTKTLVENVEKVPVQKSKTVIVAYTYTQRNSLDKIEYNPHMGWYTAAVLFTILMAVTLLLIGDRIRRSKYKKWRRKLARERRRRREVGFLPPPPPAPPPFSKPNPHHPTPT